MKVPKAIEISSDLIKYQYSAAKTDEGDAVNLGNQALIRLKSLRVQGYQEAQVLLPGETPE